MTLNDHDQASIREYLLGELSEDEQQKIEERFMVEDDFFEELEISKGELVEEYRAGELSQKERDWFEGHFLASAEGRRRQAFVMAIDSLKHSKPAPPQPSVFEKLGAFFRTHLWVAVPTATALVIVVVGLFLFRSQPQTYYAITLVNTLPTRSNEGDNSLPLKVTLPPNTDGLRASLELRKPFSPGTSFEALLDNRTDTRQVKVVEHNEKNVEVAIPVGALPRGEYVLKLIAIKADGTKEEIPGSYRFDIQ